MIPTSTGAAKAVGLVLPELKGKLDGVAIRVPTPNVSMVDLKVVTKRTRQGEINDAMRRPRMAALKAILGYRRAIVSADFNHNAVLDLRSDQTKVIDGTFLRVLSWYDNELGLSNRMADTAVAMAKLI